jgi:hypothetical protein
LWLTLWWLTLWVVADLVEPAHDTALNQRPEAFNCIGVNNAHKAETDKDAASFNPASNSIP